MAERADALRARIRGGIFSTALQEHSAEARQEAADALDVLLAERKAAREKLAAIAGRDWRTLSGKIAAAMARDGLRASGGGPDA